MAWFFRVIESEDGSWSCSHGRLTFDVHEALHDALEHCKELAIRQRPARVFVHFIDGQVHEMTAFD